MESSPARGQAHGGERDAHAYTHARGGRHPGDCKGCKSRCNVCNFEVECLINFQTDPVSVPSALIVCTLVLWAICAVIALIYRRSLGGVRQARVRSRTILTGNEREFFGRLNRALSPDFVVLPQVAMGAILEPLVRQGHPDFWKVRSLFAQKIVDFVVCASDFNRPLLVIELDDSSHDSKRDKDAARDALMLEAGIPTLRWDSRNKPTVAEIQKRVRATLATFANAA